MKNEPKVKIEIGTEFGRWTVVSFSGKLSFGKEQLYGYWCRCICGTERNVAGSQLRKGKSLSCGCYNKDRTKEAHRKEDTYTAKTSIFCHYRASARIRGLEWDLSREEFLKLMFGCCEYCGREGCMKTTKGRGTISHNGVDRLNNEKGYTRDNCVPCCWNCNNAKNDLKLVDFLEWIKRIGENLPLEKIDKHLHKPTIIPCGLEAPPESGESHQLTSFDIVQ